MVDPRRMGPFQLAGDPAHPFRQAAVVFGRGMDLPAHNEEHDVQDRHALGKGGNKGEAGEDVGKDFGEGVGEAGDGRVEQGRDGGVARTDDLRGREAFGGALAAFREEVEEEGV